MANFIKSANIKAFPAGFRKDALDTSKLTTEENLTSLTILSSDKTIGNRWITNPLNDKEDVIYIRGYKFVFPKKDIPENCTWAAIQLRELGVGNNNNKTNVLKPVDAVGPNASVLDDEGGNFLGLGFYENEPSGDDIYKVKKDSSLVLKSSEIKNGASDTNIAEQFNTKKIVVNNGTSSSSYNINIDENGINSLTLNGADEKILIKSISGNTSSLTVADDVNVDINAKVSVDNDKTTLGNITLTKDTAGNVKIDNYFNLPKNTEPNKLLTSNGETNSWISYSENNVADTIVKRSGNDIKTDTLNDVKIWLDKTTQEEPILKVTHDFVKDGTSLRSGLGVEWPATLTVSSDGSIQTDTNNDGTNVISIGAGTLIKQDLNKNFVQIGNIDDVEKVITLPFDDTLGVDEDSKLVVLTQNVRRKPDTTVEISSAWRNTASATGNANANRVAVFNKDGTIGGLAPTNHATSETTYGLATKDAGGVYGHVKLQTEDLSDTSYNDGVAASAAHMLSSVAVK